jgi:hypothetical protein
LSDRRPRVRSRHRAGLAISVTFVLAVALAGCGTAATATSPASTLPAASATQPTQTETAAPSGSGASSASTVPSASADMSAGTSRPLIVDSSLLALLPERVDGVPIVASPETAAGMTSDLSLGRSASAIAVGIALAPGDSGSEDLALVSVVKLRPGIFSDTFYDGWRSAYDTAACAPAGGVTTHRHQVAGRYAIEVTDCAGGATIYHVHLADDVLVSITAAGPRKFGELILAGLHE